MDSNIHRKDLISLGLKNTHLSAIVGHSIIFKNAPKKHGYALSYNYNQVFFLYIGCELYSLGLSFRHVDDILVSISNFDFEFDKSKIVSQKKMLLIQKDVYADRFKGMKFTSHGKDPFTGELIEILEKKRKAPINSLVLREREYDAVKDRVATLIRINLYTIAEDLEKIF